MVIKIRKFKESPVLFIFQFTDVDLSRAIFQPFPSEIIFQQYEPGKLFEVPLQLRNDDKVPRLIKVSLEFSPYFKVVALSNSAEKIAPGMAAQYTVQFFPEENKVGFLLNERKGLMRSSSRIFIDSGEGGVE